MTIRNLRCLENLESFDYEEELFDSTFLRLTNLTKLVNYSVLTGIHF